MRRAASSLASFSLVEVVIALGIVTFCILVLVGLLPLGLRTTHDARDYSAAASGVEKIATAIQQASTTNDIWYQAIGNYSNLVWQVGGPSYTASYTNISLSGDLLTTVNPQLIAHVQVNPPASLLTNGTALISVAWPSRATWNSATTNWVHAQGSVSTWLIFLPKS